MSSEFSTKLIGEPELVVVNKHLTYRRDPVRFPNGAEGEYTYVYDDYVAAATVPLDKRNGQRSVFLIWQERYPSQSMGWEIPAGAPMEGESQLDAAKRELQEEAGLVAELWYQLPRQIENVGRGNTSSDVFAAADLTVVQNELDVSEVITDGRWFSMTEVELMMLSGKINAGHTMAAIAIANAFVNHNPEHPIAQLVG